MNYLRPTRAEHPPQHPVLVYDDDCGFCLAIVRALQHRARGRLELLPFSDVRTSGLLTTLAERDLYASAHFVDLNGTEYHGGESITRALRLLPGGWTAGVLDLPGLRLARDAAYRLVEVNRHRLSRLLGMEACNVRPEHDARTNLPAEPGGADARRDERRIPRRA